MAIAIGRRGRGCRSTAIAHRELDHGVQQAQGLIMGDMFLGLRCQDVGQQEMGGDVEQAPWRPYRHD